MRGTTAVWLFAFGAACGSAPEAPPPEPAPAEPAPATARPAPPAEPAAGPVAAAALPHRLPNGIQVLLLPPTPDGIAELQLALPGGAGSGSPGLAELAAATLIGNSDASQGSLSLKQRIERLGGTIDCAFGTRDTWFAVRVPASRWRDAERALAAALATPALSRNQLERIRDELVQERISAFAADQVLAAARSFLLGDASTADRMHALLDRDPSEVTLFQARCYRPDGALLVLRVPGGAASVQEALAAGIGKWSPPNKAPAAAPADARSLQPGIHWSPGEPADLCRAAVILPLPEITRPDAADLFALHACLTLDGVGGRLEQLQRERGLARWRWQSQIVGTADARALVLTVDTTPADAVQLWQTVVAARTSLRDVPPTASELHIARRRAALTAQLAAANNGLPLRNRAAFAKPAAAEALLQQRLGQFADPRTFDAAAAAAAYLALPAAMIVFGGTPPATAADIHTFAALPVVGPAGLLPADAAAAAAAARPWLDNAMAAVGGKAVLARLDGFDAESRRRTEHAPTAKEVLQWRRRGTLQRSREVLGVDIVTTLDGTTAVEKAGTTQQTLDNRTAALLLAEHARHPLALLAAHARGELQFRPVAQRTVGDRDLMILECTSAGFDRLRVHIDTMSHLIRVVEVWQTDAEGAVVHLQEAWSDYRTTAGLRAPFRCLLEQDDGRNRVEIVHSAWTPVLRRP